MRIWRYIAKRGIQTIITLVVVILLLFVIFRLMPGDPTRFFIQPGQTQENIDRMCIQFGLCKAVPAKGTDYESAFNTNVRGSYEIDVTVYDTKGNWGTVYAAHTREQEFPPGSLGIINITITPYHIVNVTDEVTLAAEMRIPEPPLQETWVLIQNPNGTETRLGNGTLSGGYYTWTFTPEQPGVYLVTFGVRANDRVAMAPYTLAANNLPEDLAPFSLRDDHIWIEKVLAGTGVVDESRKRLHVSVVSTAAGGGLRSISNVSADIWVTNWNGTAFAADRSLVVDLLPLIHVDDVVRTTWWEEFVPYMQGMLTFSFGNSFYSKQPVIDEIAQRIGPTLLLFGSALILSTLVGVALGVMLAWYRGTKKEMSAIVVSLFFYSMPLFWFGLILLWAFGFRLGWFPLGGMITPEVWEQGTPDVLTQITDIGRHLVLPLATLMILGLAGTILLMRNSMMEVLGEDYITTAKAKGLTERQVMYKHAARNALLPVTTAVAIAAGGVISGGVLTETIFSWPGMGYYLVNRTLRQDYPAIQATFYILAILTILANWVADMLYAVLDPRVRL